MSVLPSSNPSLWKLGFTNAGTLISAAAICATFLFPFTTASGNLYQASIDSPPRLQWEANFGYCGEVAIITANLRYGQYLSQYDARYIASNATPQNKEDSQLLLGVNAMYAATQMHLKAEKWDNSGGPNPNGFLAWVKSGILANSSVLMGIYTNEYFFYNKSNPNAGQSSYDHIVPVSAVTSNFPLTMSATYHANDTITFSDNGLYTPHGKPIYTFSYSDGSFERSRQEANAKNSPPYSLPSEVKNYGLVISGIIDDDGQTLPVKLTTSVNYEKPSIKNKSNVRPKPENLTLTITVEGLQPGKKYNVYRYNSFSDVPNSSFNAKSNQAAKSWQISASAYSSHTMSEPIQSNETVIYRAVPVTAP